MRALGIETVDVNEMIKLKKISEMSYKRRLRRIGVADCTLQKDIDWKLEDNNTDGCRFLVFVGKKWEKKYKYQLL